MSCRHEHKVNETKMRSFLKSVTGRLIEITIGTLIQGTILDKLGFESAYEWGFVMTVIEEVTCFFICYLNDRAWNRISWGRNIEDVEDE